MFTLVLLYNSIDVTKDFDDLKPVGPSTEIDDSLWEEFGTKNHRKSELFFDKSSKVEKTSKSDVVIDKEEEDEVDDDDEDDEEDENDYDSEDEDHEDEEEEDYKEDSPKNESLSPSTAKNTLPELPNPYLAFDLPPPTNENPFKKIDPRFREKLNSLCKT